MPNGSQGVTGMGQPSTYPTAQTTGNQAAGGQAAGGQAAGGNSNDLAAITVSSRIAAFWKDMPKLWFTQLEAILAPQKLSQEAKFDLVVSKLGKEELNGVSDLLENAANRNYVDLKERLIKMFQESADLQFNRLVKELELGEQKPSQLCRKMADAARNVGVADDTLKRLWIQRLPTAVRTILIVSEDAKLENLAAMADKIMESIRQGVVAEIAAPIPSQSVSQSAANADLIHEFRSMVLEMKQLRGEVNELRTRRDSNRGRSRSRSGSRSQTRNPNWLCKYHYKFKDNARKCFQPCAWHRQHAAGTSGTAVGAAPSAPPAWQLPQGN